MKKIKLQDNFVFAVLLFLGCALAAAQNSDTESIPSKEDVWFFVLAGQSNMAGRGIIDSIANSYRSKNVLMMTKEGALTVATHPVHFDKPKIAAVGPGLKFAYELSLQTDKKNSIGTMCGRRHCH